jgi:hypothetical protein
MMGLQYGICFILAFRHVEFGGGFHIFGKFLGPYYTQYIKFCPAAQRCMQRFNLHLKMRQSKPKSSWLNKV